MPYMRKSTYYRMQVITYDGLILSYTLDNEEQRDKFLIEIEKCAGVKEVTCVPYSVSAYPSAYKAIQAYLAYMKRMRKIP